MGLVLRQHHLRILQMLGVFLLGIMIKNRRVGLSKHPNRIQMSVRQISKTRDASRLHAKYWRKVVDFATYNIVLYLCQTYLKFLRYIRWSINICHMSDVLCRSRLNRSRRITRPHSSTDRHDSYAAHKPAITSARPTALKFRMGRLLGRVWVAFTTSLIAFISYSSQIFVIWPWYGRELSVELLQLLLPFK